MRGETWGFLAGAIEGFLNMRIYKQERAQILAEENRKFEAEEKQRQFENDLANRKFRIDADYKAAQIEAEQALRDERFVDIEQKKLNLEQDPALFEDTRAVSKANIEQSKAAAAASGASARRADRSLEDEIRLAVAKEAAQLLFNTSQPGGGQQGRDTTDEALFNRAQAQANQKVFGKERPTGTNPRRIKPFDTPYYKNRTAATVDSIAAEEYQKLYPQFRPGMNFGAGGTNPTAGAIERAQGTLQSLVPGIQMPSLAPQSQAAPDPLDSYIQEKSSDPQFKQWYDEDPANRRRELSDWLRSKGQ